MLDSLLGVFGWLVGSVRFAFRGCADGRFDLSPIAAGIYTIQIEAEGFNTFYINDYEIKTGIIGRLNVVLMLVTPAVMV